PSFDFDDRPRRRRRRKSGGWGGGALVLGCVLLLVGGVTALCWDRIWAALNSVQPITTPNQDEGQPAPNKKATTPTRIAQAPKARPGNKTNPKAGQIRKNTDPEDGPAQPAPVLNTGLFPRRALIISVHNYLYLNPITDGPSGSVNIDRLVS